MKRIGGFVVHTILLLVLLLWTVQAIFAIKGRLFQLEIVALLGLLALALLGMLQYAQGNDAQIRVVYAIGLANILALSLVKWQLFYIPFIAAAVGLGVSFARDECQEVPEVQVHEVEPVVTEVKVESAPQKKTKRKRGRPKKK